jgi:hypothetical protein
MTEDGKEHKRTSQRRRNKECRTENADCRRKSFDGFDKITADK